MAGFRRCTLSWSAPVEAVDAFEIDAGDASWSLPDTMMPGPVPGTATTVEIEVLANELTNVPLSLRARKGDQRSAPSAPVSCVTQLYPLSDPGGVMSPDGIVVNWSNGSYKAQTIEIERAELDDHGVAGPWSPLTTLPAVMEPFGSSYLDTTATAVGVAYGYRVTEVAGDVRGMPLEMSGLPRGALLLPGSTLPLPRAIEVSDGRGHYAYRNGDRVVWGDGETWNPSAELSGTIYGSLLLDSAGLPHAVYGKSIAGTSDVMITHTWFDGTTWREDEIAQRRLGYTTGTASLLFDLDPSGTPIMAWWNVDTYPKDHFEAALRIAGSWQIATIGADLHTGTLTPDAYRVFSDQSGVPHVLLTDAATLWNLQADHAGTWTTETVPRPMLGGASLTGNTILAAGSDPDHLTLCFEVWPTDFWATQAGCIHKRPAGWMPIQPLGLWPSPAGSARSIALSPDGTRVAALYAANRGSRLYRAKVSDLEADLIGWTETALPATDDHGAPIGTAAFGFDAQNRAFVLSVSNTGSETVSSYTLERE